MSDAGEKDQNSSLRDRWSVPIADAVNNQLAKGFPQGSPFGATPDGYVDLRGLPFKQIVKRANLRRIDFTFCQTEWAGQFNFCAVEDCLFSEALLPNNYGSKFVSCRFSKAKMSGALFRGRFEGCDFSYSDISSTLGDQVVFQNCDFTGANLRKAQLTNCRFIECRFGKAKFASGSFGRSEFWACDLDLTKLGNSLIEGCRFEQANQQ